MKRDFKIADAAFYMAFGYFASEYPLLIASMATLMLIGTAAEAYHNYLYDGVFSEEDPRP